MENGGPAFPIEHGKHTGHIDVRHEGMALRDYIAIHFAQAMVKPSVELTIEDARAAYRYASLMLQARVMENP